MQHRTIEEVKVGQQAPQEAQLLVGVVDSSQLGSPEKLTELEKIQLLQRKIEHERKGKGEMLKLKEKVCQMKDEVAFAQKQSRLSLARAGKAEIQADKVAALEQQLSQTKSTLEEQIQMKDQVMAVAVRQFSRAYSDMQQGLLIRDEAIATLRKQMQMSLEYQTEVYKQSMKSAQQQFEDMKATLEHQIEVGEQARTALETQIQAKDREKAELERQLCQKEEQIKSIQQRCEVSAAIVQYECCLQQQLKEKDAKIAAISTEAKNRIEMLTDEKQKLTNQNGELEAQLGEVEFFRDIYSQESDQLRADLMDKIAEIDNLRKGQADMVPEGTFPLTLPAGGAEDSCISPCKNCHEHFSPAAGSGKVEWKQQYVQTETLDISNHQVQAKSIEYQQSTVDMQGTEVIAQKTFTLTKEADNLSFEGYEFLEGSLPLEVSETQLNVQVSLSGQLQRPSNSELLCTVSILVRSPQGIYSQSMQPVLEQTKLGQAQAQPQEQQRSKSLACTETSCQTEQKQEGEIVEQCCAQLFIQKKLVSEWKLDFVVTKNHESCSTVVRKEYSSHSQEQLSFSFSFKQDLISLQIPEDGLQLGGWNITPLYDSKIMKQEVNCFSSGKRIPRCELLLQWDEDTPPACLQCQIGLTGACDHSYFLLCVNPGVTLPHPSSEPTVKGFIQDKDEAIAIGTLADITSYLHPLDRTAVFNLGLVLGLDYNRLKTMTDSPCFLEDMLASWLQRMDQVLKTGVPTWKRLVEALEDPRVGQNGIASKIKQDDLCN